MIQKMQGKQEFGEFFPIETSPFPYEETLAQDAFPLSGFDCTQPDNVSYSSDTKNHGIPGSRLPDLITEIPDDILDWPIICRVSGRPFKIIKKELDYYRANGIPVPHLHPDERHRVRKNLRNPYFLWSRKCDACGIEIASSYNTERSERVLCEECYLQEVY